MNATNLNVRLALGSEIRELQRIEAAGDAQFIEAGHVEFEGAGTISTDEATEAIVDGRLAVATVDSTSIAAGEVAGFILIAMEGTELAIAQVSVWPDHQQRCIGRTLMEWAFEEAATEVITTSCWTHRPT
ncbi:MAG: ribosomal protein S18 acetylase RimI-like enzyme [Candidatus Poriferisodalaceae bacterium]|jgi:ribosomal protein S18 acetylase RimI-like enzyme